MNNLPEFKDRNELFCWLKEPTEEKLLFAKNALLKRKEEKKNYKNY